MSTKYHNFVTELIGFRAKIYFLVGVAGHCSLTGDATDKLVHQQKSPTPKSGARFVLTPYWLNRIREFRHPESCAISATWLCIACGSSFPGRYMARRRRQPMPLHGSPTESASSCLDRY